MPTIALLSQKGGAGKTTVAVALARAFQLEGKDVVLVDADPQGSARDWRAAREEPLVPVIAIDRPTLDKDLSVVSRESWVVIDGPPRSNEIIVSAIRAADLVLIPVQPSPLDVWAAAEVVELVKTRQAVTGGKPLGAFVVSRAQKRTELARKVREPMEEYGLPALQWGTTQRQVYPASMSDGLTPLDIDPKGDAAYEIRQIVREIKEMLALQVSANAA